MYQGQGSSEVKLGGKCWFSLFGSPLRSWKSSWNVTRVKDAMGVPLYVNEIQGQGSSEVKLGGKCKTGIIFLKSPITTKLDL